MRCCRKILHISYKDHVINEEVRAKKNAYKQTPIPSEESTFSSKTAVGIFAGRLPRLANTIALGNVFYSVSRMEETVGNWNRSTEIRLTGWALKKQKHLILIVTMSLSKLTEVAQSFWFCSRVYFCLYDLFNCISFHKFSRQVSVFSLCSSGLISALLILPTTYLFTKVFFGPDIILCGWLGSKHQLTN